MEFPSLDGESEEKSGMSMPPPPVPMNESPGQQTLQMPEMMMPQAAEMMQQSLCEKHFPEPIIFMGAEPFCKKCIPD